MPVKYIYALLQISVIQQLFTMVWFMKHASTPSYMIYGDPPQTSQRALIRSSNESHQMSCTCLKTQVKRLSIQNAEISNMK